MRSIAKTSISHGLHNIPVRICSALSSSSVTKIHNACPNCKSAVGKINKCKGCGTELSENQLLKSYDLENEKKIIFSKEQIDSLKTLEISIDVLGTLPYNKLDVRLIVGGYYLLPDKQVKAWDIIRQALDKTEKHIIVKYAIRGRTHLGALRGSPDSIYMYELEYPENLTKIDQAYNVQTTKSEVEQGVKFINSLVEVSQYEIKDDYASALQTLIEGGQLEIPQKMIEEKDEMAFFS